MATGGVRRSGGAGDLAAFERIYEEHVWDVYGFIAYRVSGRENVEDLTQQTFERAVRAWSRFDPARASARTWLLAIARNLVIDHARARRPQQPLDPEEAEGLEPLAYEQPLPNGLSPELSAALAKLGQRDREIIALRFGGDMKGSDIADLLGLTLANVQQILSRSLRRLRDELSAGSAPAP